MISLTTILTSLALALGLSFSTPTQNTSSSPEFLGPPIRIDDREPPCLRPCIYNEKTGTFDCPCA